MTPVRIQLRRARGWRLQDVSMAINGLPARSCCRPGPLGNYHPASRWDDPEWEFGPYPSWRACAADCYRMWITQQPAFMAWWRLTTWGSIEQMSGDPTLKAALQMLPSIRNHNLACFCPLPAAGEPDHCHAAVLLEIARGHAE